MIGAAFSFWDEWVLYHKVTFDGVNRLIVVSSSTTSVDIKADVYSAWKEWVLLEDHSKFEPAIRGIGGDPVGPGIWAGDIYFLMNGWRIYVDHAVDFTGVVYTEEGANPFITPSSANVVRSTASNLALSYGTTPEQAATLDSINTHLTDLKDETFGRWDLNFANDTMTLYRPDGSVLKTFSLVRSGETPPNYVTRIPQ